MKCVHENKLWDNRWCSKACRYCTSEQEATCWHKKVPDPVPPTNADHIRSMSDEDLADFLVDLADDGDLLIRDWLKQPYKEGV